MKAQYNTVLNVSKDGICHHSLLRTESLKVPGITYPWHVLLMYMLGSSIRQ